MKRVLIANRGEIAVRVIRACREEGLESVAVYSEADRRSPHVAAADMAVELGPPPAAESYLNIERLLSAARRTEADAVHPGYGFLAERADFAEAVEAAGLTFVGPSPSAIRAMGEKTTARRLMEESGVSVVPGMTSPVAGPKEAAVVAAEIGYPVLLKAVAGGGGKGMRRADSERELQGSFQQATSEAMKAFGNGDIYVERFIEHPRHVEIQVLADTHGTTVHFGERECSIQRRHQKLIEEAPSPAVGPELRELMGATAVRAARAVGYVGAGTVEFLLEPGESGNFYFLEMNTRIQVEHPVTEMVYGVDLVRQQLRIAAGAPIEADGRSLEPKGHAIECRITSEDPFNDFLPDTGAIQYLNVPSGPGVRWDGGIAVGDDIGLYYDPLLAKLIVWGETRAAAIGRMRRALDELVIVGVATSQPFHRLVLEHEPFTNGSYDIGYLEQHGDALLAAADDAGELERIAVAAALAEHQRMRIAGPQRVGAGDGRVAGSAWLRAARLDGQR
ncbi:MAG: acetyl-CoA carboxylase biotin carboxylase subunit [Gemmatimonadetes bacterium]|nr:acetyl-CoA carboxylase biotin carboxylase subunit [Gemmatimonadota bacterium]MCH8934776.1 acetyl-CoA carboxylase biotin carboxylase subunit [Gemmatimonadota bacterium]